MLRGLASTSDGSSSNTLLGLSTTWFIVVSIAVVLVVVVLGIVLVRGCQGAVSTSPPPNEPAKHVAPYDPDNLMRLVGLDGVTPGPRIPAASLISQRVVDKIGGCLLCHAERASSTMMQSRFFDFKLSGFTRAPSDAITVKRIVREHGVADDPELVALVEEIALMSTLSHPKIATFLGVSWNTLRDVAMVQEFLGNGSLASVLAADLKREQYGQPRQFAWFSPHVTAFPDKASIALDMIEGLSYLHAHSPPIVHRFLSSDNVWLSNEGDAKLINIGSPSQKIADVQNSTCVAWLAPEILRGEAYTPKANMYAFGVILTELASHKRPFNGVAIASIVMHVTSENKHPTIADTECPDFICDLAERCMSANPQDRPTAAMVLPELLFRINRVKAGSNASGKDEPSGTTNTNKDAPTMIPIKEESNASGSTGGEKETGKPKGGWMGADYGFFRR